MSIFDCGINFATYIGDKFLKNGIDLPYSTTSKLSNFYEVNETLIINKILTINIFDIYTEMFNDIKNSNCTPYLLYIMDKFSLIYNELLLLETNSNYVDIEDCPFILSEINNHHMTRSANNISPTTKSTLNALSNNCGIYFLYDHGKQLVYIGRSTNLSNRIVLSAIERKSTYFKYLSLNNYSDTKIIELLFITTLKPPYNFEFSNIDPPTIKIDITVTEPRMELIELFDKKENKEVIQKPTFKIFRSEK